MTNQNASTPVQDDIWSKWLLSRDGGSEKYGQVLSETLQRMRDRVLDGARLGADKTLVDIGAGDGLVGLGAIERIGPSLHVIMTDVSAPMLQYIKTVATERGIVGQCAFQECSAESLDDCWDASADAITTRAVLAFVKDKPAAFAEFHRVLRPGGRISLAEPILQDNAFEVIATQKFIEANSANPQIASVELLHRMRATQFPSTEAAAAKNPLTNYSERDLVRFAQEAGFVEIHLELHIDVAPCLVAEWDVYLKTAPHPWAPKPGEVLATRYSEAERIHFEHLMRPAIEGRQTVATDNFAYLTATKPNASARS